MDSNRIGREVDELIQFLLLRSLKRRQQIILAARERMARMHSQSYAHELAGLQAADHRLHAVVTRRRPLRLDLQSRPGQIELIINHDQIRNPDRMLFHQRSERRSAQIHVRLRFGQHHLAPLDFAQTDERLGIPAGDADAVPLGQPVHRKETQVMRRERILLARVPQTGHQEHAGLLLLALFLVRGRRFLFLLALLDHFGLGGGSGSRHGFGGRGFGFGLERYDVRDHGFGRARQLHGAG